MIKNIVFFIIQLDRFLIFTYVLYFEFIFQDILCIDGLWCILKWIFWDLKCIFKVILLGSFTIKYLTLSFLKLEWIYLLWNLNLRLLSRASRRLLLILLGSKLWPFLNCTFFVPDIIWLLRQLRSGPVRPWIPLYPFNFRE